MNTSTNAASTAIAAASAAVGMQTAIEMKFNFRTEKIRDDDGNVIGTGRKHPEVVAPLPVPTSEQLIEMLASGGAAAELIHELVRNGVFDAAKQQINNWRESQPDDATFTPSNFDLSKLTLEAIATMPKGERKSSAISDEDLTAFLNDYHHVMVNVVGYEEKRVKLAMTHFKVQLRRIKNDKAAVQKLLDLLNLWASKTEALEDHAACFEDLVKRGNKYLAAEDSNKADAF